MKTQELPQARSTLLQTTVLFLLILLWAVAADGSATRDHLPEQRTVSNPESAPDGATAPSVDMPAQAPVPRF